TLEVALGATVVIAASDPNGGSRLPSRGSSLPSALKSSHQSRSVSPQLKSAHDVRCVTSMAAVVSERVPYAGDSGSICECMNNPRTGKPGLSRNSLKLPLVFPWTPSHPMKFSRLPQIEASMGLSDGLINTN